MPPLPQADQPFARHDLDSGYESTLKERARFGDPFAHLAKRPATAAEVAGRVEAAALTQRYDAKKLEESGEKPRALNRRSGEDGGFTGSCWPRFPRSLLHN